MKAKGIIVTKADKGNKVVVLDKVDYINRTEEMLTQGKEFEKVEKDPLNRLISETNAALKKVVNILDDKQKSRLKVSNPVLPRLYALPKVHKPGNKMRPIVNKVNSPAYGVAKWLVKQFNLLEPFETLDVKNTFEFVEKAQKINFSDEYIMVSFDVESMFPSIPVEKALLCLKKWLEDNELSKKVVDEFLILTRLCVNQSYFQFNGKFYKQGKGLSMGECLSPILSKLYMSEYELNLLKQNSRIFLCWWRFVDDVFSMVRMNEVDQAIDTLNSQNDDIHWTVEVEVNNKLPFLDVSVSKLNGRLEFDVYRKPTHNTVYINNNSYNPKAHKLATFNSMINRMIRLPLSETNREKEKSRILHIAWKNNFKEAEIRRLIDYQYYKQKLRNTTTLDDFNDDSKRFSPFPYNPKFNGKFQKIFEKYGCQLVPINTCNLKSQFHGQLKDKVLDEDCSGIYEISCMDCDKIYIGQSRRKIKIRGREHKRNTVNQEVEKSAVAKHHWECKHQIDFNPKLVKKVRDRRELNAEERISIYKKKDLVFNTDLEGVNNILFALIEKTGKIDNVVPMTERGSDPPQSQNATTSNVCKQFDEPPQRRYDLRPRKTAPVASRS